MRRLRLRGVKQNTDGSTVYKVDRVDTNGTTIIPDEKVTTYLEYTEMTAPAAGGADTARVYAEDNGSGKTRIVVKFATGAAIVIATQA